MIYKSESFRNLKVASVLNRAISKVLMHDFYSISCNVINISQVEVSSDIKNATVFVVISGDSANKEELIKELNDMSYFIRKAIFSYVDLRYVPRLYFKLDYHFDNLVKVNELLESQ
ncbi:30S ribosome-binding factor RbfA [Ehrlichia ruminantium]|uniref:Ribosome-binding factor A n=1 Tax=Ehrlichia ruminantium TaxID=779 RepID=A0AAE6QAH8_EHRRU|nr:30S ribosome-binding factor RbfA [Ehrlichia ruminantium]QGR02536.1 30S ribosome-binding factor RbfA [Ehrlichia ruminantium]QGR03457.1 30S ribosome-binding factor RbfA [Ehrlichia ruminantium]QGR04382.1 30S ribosome-binding factor RbfA [Ehrlichia ruminantium]